MAKCSGITQSGTACKGKPIGGSAWCYYHHPDYAQERKRHGAKGGKRGGRGRPLTALRDLKIENADIRRRLLDGELEPGVSAVAIQSLNIDIRIALADVKITEHEDVRARVEELEEALEEQRRNSPRGSYGL